MKKTVLTIGITMALGVLAIANFANIAAAQVTINEDLQPGFAVGVDIGQGEDAAAAAANAILQIIAGSLIFVAGPIAVLILAIGGVRYVISHGDQTQMEAAKKTITWAIVGMLVIIVSWMIVTNIIRILGG